MVYSSSSLAFINFMSIRPGHFAVQEWGILYKSAGNDQYFTGPKWRFEVHIRDLSVIRPSSYLP